jgi:hypothetical protein
VRTNLTINWSCFEYKAQNEAIEQGP